MVQARTLRGMARPTRGALATAPGPQAGAGPAAGTPSWGDDIQDMMGSITDRADLERLFDRRVALSDILRLMGREVSREQIHDLLASPHLERDLRKLLG